MGLFCLIRVSGGAFTQGILLRSLQEIQWEITLNKCLSAWVLVIVYQKKYVIVDAITLPNSAMKDQTVSSYQFNFKCDKVAILRLVHDESSSQGSCDICDNFYLLSPWCILVGIEQGMLICPVKMESVLNGSPSNAGDEWKSFFGPEEKYSIIYGDGTLIIQQQHTVAIVAFKFDLPGASSVHIHSAVGSNIQPVVLTDHPISDCVGTTPFRLGASANEALNEFVRVSNMPETSRIMSQLLQEIMRKLNINFHFQILSSGDKGKQSDLHALLCGVLQVIIQKLSNSDATSGGIFVPCGGYVDGKKKLVEAAVSRLSAPGLGSGGSWIWNCCGAGSHHGLLYISKIPATGYTSGMKKHFQHPKQWECVSVDLLCVPSRMSWTLRRGCQDIPGGVGWNVGV
jgi:hypothetical protein